jgi:hypothetical protein
MQLATGHSIVVNRWPQMTQIRSADEHRWNQNGDNDSLKKSLPPLALICVIGGPNLRHLRPRCSAFICGQQFNATMLLISTVPEIPR